MTETIENLEPKNVWKIFSAINKIPRPSSHEKQIAEYLINFAKKHNYECVKDEVGNIIIDVPATEDKKDAPLVILQGHMDMVPVADDGYQFNFLTDPIEAYVEDGFVKAKHTTLGADNGIAMAMALAIFEDKNLSHGPLRAIFTVEEETTMKGASNLDKKYLENAPYLINLDSEDNGYLFVNCAGSIDVNLEYKASFIQVENTDFIKIELSHFKGGHSGADIHLGHANAIKVLASILNNLSEDYDFFIKDIQGGTVRNSIPAKSSVTIAITKEQKNDFVKDFAKEFDIQKDIYKATDESMQYELNSADEGSTLGYTQSLDLIHLLCALPSGIDKLSAYFDGIVETSINLSIVRMTDDKIFIEMMARSLSDNGLDDIVSRVNAISSLIDDVEFSTANRHLPWSSPMKNHLIDVLNDSYKEITGHEFKITALHAGVECAQFAILNKELQLISIGPTILNPHSPSERVDIEGTNQMYKTLSKALSVL